MEGKKKNIFIGILGATTVAVAGVAVYFGLKYNSSRIENAKLQEIVNEPKQTEVVEKEKIVTEYAIPEINYENCLNPRGSLTYTEAKGDYLAAYGASIYPSEYSLEISLDADKLNKLFPELTLYDENGKSTSHITRFHEFDKKITKVYFYNMGQIFQDELVLCVLEDGSVYCTRLYNAISNNDYDNYTKLDEISDIIDLKPIFITSPGPGGSSIAAIRRDGKFYDLEVILRNRGLI